MGKKKFYDCDRCPAMCCTTYASVALSEGEPQKMAAALGVSVPQFLVERTEIFTSELTKREGIRLRRKADPATGGDACGLFDTETRRCTVYDARPQVCRAWPDKTHQPPALQGRCQFYDLMMFVRGENRDPQMVPVIQLTRLRPQITKE